MSSKFLDTANVQIFYVTSAVCHCTLLAAVKCMWIQTEFIVVFQTFGDMNEINRYLRKAQALQTRLETAFEKVMQLLTICFTVLFVRTIIHCTCGLCLFAE